jgi:glycine/D-amino acid oxidase-like deaminating enzyme
MKVAERWAGVIDATPDGVPVISEVPFLPGFYIASGFSGHGFGIGPGAGHLMADLVMGEPPIVDPAPYRYQRLVKPASAARPKLTPGTLDLIFR